MKKHCGWEESVRTPQFSHHRLLGPELNEQGPSSVLSKVATIHFLTIKTPNVSSSKTRMKKKIPSFARPGNQDPSSFEDSFRPLKSDSAALHPNLRSTPSRSTPRQRTLLAFRVTTQQSLHPPAISHHENRLSTQQKDLHGLFPFAPHHLPNQTRQNRSLSAKPSVKPQRKSPKRKGLPFRQP